MQVRKVRKVRQNDANDTRTRIHFEEWTVHSIHPRNNYDGA